MTPTPNCFIQYKGTDICMDFHCSCGDYGHIDAEFAYFIKCNSCGAIFEMPWHVYPRQLSEEEVKNFNSPCVVSPERDEEVEQ